MVPFPDPIPNTLVEVICIINFLRGKIIVTYKILDDKTPSDSSTKCSKGSNQANITGELSPTLLFSLSSSLPPSLPPSLLLYN